MNRRIRALIILLILLPMRAQAEASLCEVASYAAARAQGIPPDVMMAISLTETGRRQDGAVRPWPWTVNMQGAGHWFDTEQAALDFAQLRFEQGARSFDVGCFQLNYRWHGMHFASIEQMFDPMANARYAAQFLSDLYAETGSWSAAAGAYHSRTPSFANRYIARFDEIRARLGTDVPPPELVVALVAHPAVAIHPFLSAPAMPAASPYGTVIDPSEGVQPLMQTAGQGGAAPLGSLAAGMIETQTHSLLVRGAGALF